MLGILNDKIEKQGLANIGVEHLDIENGGILEGSYQLVVSSMTLHHIREIPPLIGQFFRITAPGGYLCLADLDPDDGRFHGDNDTVFHSGFERSVLRGVLEKAGYIEVRDKTAAVIGKSVTGGEKRSFEVFLMTARKLA